LLLIYNECSKLLTELIPTYKNRILHMMLSTTLEKREILGDNIWVLIHGSSPLTCFPVNGLFIFLLPWWWHTSTKYHSVLLRDLYAMWWLKVFGHLNEFEKELPDQIFILFTKGHWIKKQYSTVYSAVNIIIIMINCTEIYDYSVEIILKFIFLWFFSFSKTVSLISKMIIKHSIIMIAKNVI